MARYLYESFVLDLHGNPITVIADNDYQAKREFYMVFKRIWPYKVFRDDWIAKTIHKKTLIKDLFTNEK